MDTTTVNFAINKLTEGWQRVAPAMHDVGGDYVRYVVAVAIAWAVIIPLLTTAAWVLVVWCMRKLKDAGCYSDWPVGTFLAWVLAIALTVASAFCFADAVLALTNPKMFTVHQLIEAARR